MELLVKNVEQSATFEDYGFGFDELSQCRHPFQLLVFVMGYQVAGNSLFKKYKRQFFKVLLYIHTRFLVGLANSDDIEAKAVFSRLQTYLKTNQFGKPPPSKTMPRTAASLRVVT